jgi:hypothetical protein
MRVQRVTSKKHPGAIFFKEHGTKKNFICKFYPGQETAAEQYERFCNSTDHESARGVSLSSPQED